MKKTGKTLLLGLIAFSGLMSEVRAQARLSNDTIVLGDTTVLTVKGEECKGWKSLSDEYIEVLQEEPGANNNEWMYWLTSYDPGTHYIKWSESDSLPLVVQGVTTDPRSDNPKELADSVAIEDIVDIESEKNPPVQEKGFPWWLLAAGVVVATLLIWWLCRKKSKDNETSSEPLDMRTPNARALDCLEMLRQDHLWQSGRVKEYYTKLTDILRVFIEEATTIRATEMTSEECVNELMNKYNLSFINTLLKDIFTTADLVKFAKREPLPNEHQRAYEQAVQFVNELWNCINESSGNEGNDGNNE